ncbi:MAG TPA: hypothetical protein VMF11_13920 [Candidatus Baltobacteraceae bacterium]|nr:hypothetical protein [Candidatus Baltobacteraceae bacterium]
MGKPFDRRTFLLAAGLEFCAVIAPADSAPAASASPTPEPPLPGKTFLPQLPSAPFPHPSRANGHEYDGKFYSASEHYSDSTVGIYVPAKFRPSAGTDFVVHFHGWNNHVTEVFRRYELREQLEESGRNAVLVVPQGPKDAPDSGDGKLELDPNGFARFMSDVVRFLRDRGVTGSDGIGRIVLSSHSGGYGGLGGVLTRGGLNAHVSDVLLFDSAYGYFDAVAAWAASAANRHLLSLFTDDTALGNTELMSLLQGKSPFQVLNAAAMTLSPLQTREATFVLTTSVAHDELLQRYHWYALFLQTTALTA